MKIKSHHQYDKLQAIPLRKKLIASLPRYAPAASKLAPLLNLRDVMPGAPWLTEKLFRLSARRRLPRWSTSPLPTPRSVEGGRKVVLFIDTFSRHFERENIRGALDVLEAAGHQIEI